MTVLELKKFYGAISLDVDHGAPDEPTKAAYRTLIAEHERTLAELNPSPALPTPDVIERAAKLRADVERLRLLLGRDRFRYMAPPSSGRSGPFCVGLGYTKKAALADAAKRLGRS